MEKKNKIQAVRELVKSRNFMLITDRIALFSFRLKKPTSMNDHVTMAAQKAQLHNFKDNIEDMLKKFEAQYKKFVPGISKAPRKKAKK